jgi:hypothetical protein
VGNDVGHASALDSALLVVMWGACFGALQGAAICTAEELRLDSYRGYLERLLPPVQEQVSHQALAFAVEREPLSPGQAFHCSSLIDAGSCGPFADVLCSFGAFCRQPLDRPDEVRHVIGVSRRDEVSVDHDPLVADPDAPELRAFPSGTYA